MGIKRIIIRSISSSERVSNVEKDVGNINKSNINYCHQRGSDLELDGADPDAGN